MDHLLELECEAEAESVIRCAVTLHRMDDLSIQEQKFRSRHNIGIQIAVVPGHLDAATSIQPEKQNFSRKNIHSPALEQQIGLGRDIIHVSGQKNISGQPMFIAQADRIDEKGKRDKIVRRSIGLRPSVVGIRLRDTENENSQHHQTRYH